MASPSATRKMSTWFFDNIAVVPTYQSCGCGAQLLTYVHHLANGSDIIRLYTNEKMTENLSWYRSHGYVEIERRVEEGFSRVYFKKTMRKNRLGLSDINVSVICLGSMTWGSQNTESEAHSQIDYALEHGVNFIDTAEMYPTTPLDIKTQGLTESYIGSWVKKSGRRADVIIATKVTGEGNQPYIHDGMPINPKKIRMALEGSLKRLQTDCIDLYQLHWPNRGSYHFRQWWNYDPSRHNTVETLDHIREVLFTLQQQVDAGKIRTIGLSNETCWGVMKFLQTAKDNQLPRVVSIQNEYSLLCRLYDRDFAELTQHESVGLLAFSPLAAGLLSGKYAGGQIPAGSRRIYNDDLSGRFQQYSEPALNAYLQLAKKHGLDAAQMALAFCLERPFMTSTIIGATSIQQLKNNIAAADLLLSEDVKQEIIGVFRKHPIPM